MTIQNNINGRARELRPDEAEFERRVKKLVKRGFLEASKESGDYKLALGPKLKARKPRTEAAKLVGGRLGVGGVLAGAAVINGSKSAVGVIDIGDKNSVSFDGLHVQDGLSAGVNVAGVLTYGVAGGINAAKLHATLETDQYNMAMAAQHAQGAHMFMRWGGIDGGEEDYKQFCKYTEPVFGKTGHRSSSSLDKQVYGLNIPRYFANMGASVAGLVGALAKLGQVASANLTITTTFSSTVTTTVATTVAAVASGVTLGVLTLLGAGCEAGVAYAQDKKARREVKANKNASKGLRKWEDKQKAMNASGPDAVLDQALINAATKGRERRLESHKRARANAKVSFAKSGIATFVAVTSVALLLTVSVATAGIAVGVLGGLLAAGCLTYGVVQARRELKDARETKRSQRQARHLMSRYSIEEIKQMMRGRADRVEVSVTTNERKGFFTRERHDHRESVNIKDNGYLSVEIWAHDLAVDLGKLDWNNENTHAAIKAICSDSSESDAGDMDPTAILGKDAVKILSRMKASGMESDKLLDMCQNVMSKPAAGEELNDSNGVKRRSALLRPHIAAAERFAWSSEKPSQNLGEAGRDKWLVKPLGKSSKQNGTPRKPESELQVERSREEKSTAIKSTFSTVSLDGAPETEERGFLPSQRDSAPKPATIQGANDEKSSIGVLPLIPSFGQQASFKLKSGSLLQPSRGGTPKKNNAGSSPLQAPRSNTVKDVKMEERTGATESQAKVRPVGQNASPVLSDSEIASLDATSQPNYEAILKGKKLGEVELQSFPDLPSIPPQPSRAARSPGTAPQPKSDLSAVSPSKPAATPQTPRVRQTPAPGTTKPSSLPEKSTSQVSSSPSNFSASQLVALDSVPGSPQLVPMLNDLDNLPRDAKSGSKETRAPRSPRRPRDATSAR